MYYFFVSSFFSSVLKNQVGNWLINESVCLSFNFFISSLLNSVSVKFHFESFILAISSLSSLTDLSLTSIVKGLFQRFTFNSPGFMVVSIFMLPGVLDTFQSQDHHVNNAENLSLSIPVLQSDNLSRSLLPLATFLNASSNCATQDIDLN